MDKKMVMLGMMIGSGVGGLIPTLFGVDAWSFITILSGFAGGILGIWLALKATQ